ncbi:hypothetical protein ADUPG1_007587, partial [Aduncisulcus paluster]
MNIEAYAVIFYGNIGILYATLNGNAYGTARAMDVATSDGISNVSPSMAMSTSHVVECSPRIFSEIFWRMVLISTSSTPFCASISWVTAMLITRLMLSSKACLASLLSILLDC